MQSKKIIYFIIIYFFFFINSHANEIKIISKVDNKIITNFDLENQIKYLMIMNNNLKNLTKLELIELSRNSLIKYIIKKEETDKFFNVNEISNLEEKLIKQNYLSLGLKNKTEYLSLLNNKKLDIDFIKNKLVVEQLWNKLIYDKFHKKIKIDEKEIRKKIGVFKSNLQPFYKVDLSEILFEFETSLDELNKFINEYGFENAAIKYSISNTSSSGGKIGWINLSNLTPEIQKEILNLKIGENTKPIKIANGNLIIKLNSKKEIEEKFDLDKETEKQILFEQNRQLNSYSINYYKKIKQNTSINEY